ncbi:protein GRAVITROPIC IN THE LIGHT 1-like isoform X1 [Primulina tabacum]|uniref:protein GRAVITROPIC IN THE LIGHT 1-like isoform X1 n=2 Tax=Primulina tabacum TaxID=48773 RepID=UPI003F5ACEE0
MLRPDCAGQLSMMDSVKRSAVAPSENQMSHTLAKVLHIRAVTGKAPDDGILNTKYHGKIEKDQMKSSLITSFNYELEELKDRVVKEAFLAKLFAGISSVKAAYAQLQFAQYPYDADGIQSADQTVVSELNNLSQLKQSYSKKQLNMMYPDINLPLTEIQEQTSQLKTYEISSKKLKSQLKSKDSVLTFLKHKLAEAIKNNKLLEKRLISVEQSVIPKSISPSSLNPSHFISYSRQALKSVQAFTRLLINEMECASWDLDAAASLVEPGISFWTPNHKSFAFESFVCREMFDGFNYLDFCTPESLLEHKDCPTRHLDRFIKMRSVKLVDCLAWKPRSNFATFFRIKYLKLINPKMEEHLFGDMDQGNLVNSAKIPETPFLLAFSEMLKHIWLLHYLALSFDPKVSIFQAKKGCRYSEVYMESLNDEVFLLPDGLLETDPRVGFTVFPGFKISKTIIQCHVYLC